MNNKTPFTWRKGISLSATFLFCLLVSVACKKKENTLGQNNIDQNELLQSGTIDTFSLVTFSYVSDSIISDNPPFGVLGSYNDPVFGTYNAEIYTQLRLSGTNPDFGDVSGIVVDSLVLALEYVGLTSFYGEEGDQTIEVYEIGEDLNIDSTYYSSDVKSSTGSNLVVPGMEVLDMDASNTTVVDNDTIDSQLRIHLNTAKADALIAEASTGTAFSDNDAFLDYFKGLHIKTNNFSQSSGQGGAFYFNMTDPETKLIIYYTQDGEQKEFDFLINSSCADFNHVDIDNSMTHVETVINDTISGQEAFYAQSYGARGVVQIPGLDNIPDNAVVHSATLFLPTQYQSGTKYSPGFDVSIAITETAGDSQLFGYGTAAYSSFTKGFEIDLRTYVQGLISNQIENHGLIISPILHNTSAERIIFNGPLTSNKEKPVLKILFTEF